VTVAISYYPYAGQLEIDADPSGHFHFADVPGGEGSVAASIGKDMDCLRALGPSIYVNVGQSLQDVKVFPLKSNPCWATPPATPSPTPEPKANATTLIDTQELSRQGRTNDFFTRS
jgi:hypothetical protein